MFISLTLRFKALYFGTKAFVSSHGNIQVKVLSQHLCSLSLPPAYSSPLPSVFLSFSLSPGFCSLSFPPASSQVFFGWKNGRRVNYFSCCSVNILFPSCGPPSETNQSMAAGSISNGALQWTSNLAPSHPRPSLWKQRWRREERTPCPKPSSSFSMFSVISAAVQVMSYERPLSPSTIWDRDGERMEGLNRTPCPEPCARFSMLHVIRCYVITVCYHQSVAHLLILFSDESMVKCVAQIKCVCWACVCPQCESWVRLSTNQVSNWFKCVSVCRLQVVCAVGVGGGWVLSCVWSLDFMWFHAPREQYCVCVCCGVCSVTQQLITVQWSLISSCTLTHQLPLFCSLVLSGSPCVYSES